MRLSVLMLLSVLALNSHAQLQDVMKAKDKATRDSVLWILEQKTSSGKTTAETWYYRVCRIFKDRVEIENQRPMIVPLEPPKKTKASVKYTAAIKDFTALQSQIAETKANAKFERTKKSVPCDTIGRKTVVLMEEPAIKLYSIKSCGPEMKDSSAAATRILDFVKANCGG